jgi:hypothetical protein
MPSSSAIPRDDPESGRKGRQLQAAWVRGRSRSFPVRCFWYPPWVFLVNRSWLHVGCSDRADVRRARPGARRT